MAGFKDFTAATALSADVDTYLMRQTVMRFADQATMISELSGDEEDGMMAMSLDDHTLWEYRTALLGWKPINSPWAAYTPSWTNLTVGAATVDAKARYAAGDLRVRGTITFAADTSISGTVFQTIPQSVTADAGWQGGVGLANDAGTRIYPLVIGVTASGTTFSFIHAETGGVVTATAPFTWTTSDQLTWDFTVGV